MTLSEYAEMLEEQNWQCKICGIEQDQNTDKRKLAVDHDHKTGKVRGILCARCNIAISYLENNPDWVNKAVLYLEKYS